MHFFNEAPSRKTMTGIGYINTVSKTLIEALNIFIFPSRMRITSYGKSLFVNPFLFLLTIPNILNNMDYTITYFLPIPSTERRTRARSELLNVFLMSSRVKFYTALPVSKLLLTIFFSSFQPKVIH